MLEGLRGEDSIAKLCRRESIAQGVYYKWSKDFMEAGKRSLAGDTSRSANTDEVRDLRREDRDMKEVVAEQRLKMRLLKKSMIGDGESEWGYPAWRSSIAVVANEQAIALCLKRRVPSSGKISNGAAPNIRQQCRGASQWSTATWACARYW